MRAPSDGDVVYWSDGAMQQWSDATLQHSNIPILRRSSLLLLFDAFRFALVDFFGVLQLAADGLVTAGNDFLAFLQTVHNFHVRIVRNAAFDAHHLRVIVLRQENHLDRRG